MFCYLYKLNVMFKSPKCCMGRKLNPDYFGGFPTFLHLITEESCLLLSQKTR